jgi:type III pantothenate kinase
MLLCVDIGNTNITFGLFEGNKFVKEFRLQSDIMLSQIKYENKLKEIFTDYEITKLIMASVVDELTEKFALALENVFSIKPLIVTPRTKAGITIIADNIDEVGTDRIANAAAVAGEYNKAVIVIDFGTATTFDIVNSKKEFCGGIIIPGVKTQLHALFQATSKLPEFSVDESPTVLGQNTKDAIMAGVIRGCACAIDGLIDQCEEALGENAILVATGGLSSLISGYMKHKIDKTNPILTLEGLKKIYEMNM